MNKYDTQIMLDKKSSLTYMVSHIASGSTVLEFGPATGYVTCYLKKEKRCKVYIIEVDQEAYESALVYAEEGICCDAEKLEWIDRFQGMQFDYITFADVLEHLRNPEVVLAKCLPFLKEDGRILVSIPNIAHNAVLIDLYNNKFQYRKTGILDNTHLRFYTHDSLRELFHNCGLRVVEEDAVEFNLEYVGFGNSETDVPEDFWKELKTREYGYVNQFLFELERNTEEYYTQEGILSKEKQEGSDCFRDIKEEETCLYYIGGDEDGEFTEEKKLLAQMYVEKGNFHVEYILENIEPQKLLFELFEYHCVIEEMVLETDANGVALELKPIGGFKLATGGIGFICDFPKYELTLHNKERIGKIKIIGKVRNIEQSELKIYIMGLLAENKETSSTLQHEIKRLNFIIDDKQSIIHEMNDTIKKLSMDHSEAVGTLEQEIERLNQVILDKLNTIHEMNDTIKKLSKGHSEAVGALEQEIGRLNQVILDKLNIIHEMSDTINERNQKIITLNEKLKDKEKTIYAMNEIDEINE